MAGNNSKQQQPSPPQSTPVAQQLAKLRSNGHQAPAAPIRQGPQKRKHRATISFLVITLTLASGILWRQGLAWYIALIPLLLLLLIGFILIGYIPRWSTWTGFGEYNTPGHDYQRSKTLWDWLQLMGLLAVPIAVVIASAWFSAQQNHDLQIAAAQRQQDQAIVKDQQEQTILETYLDRMQDLLTSSNLSDPKAPSEVRALAQARTLTALPRLDPGRKRIIVQFLKEANLINYSKPIVNLSNADLSNADLSNADLSGAFLSHAFLDYAHLNKANFSGATLSGATLRGAFLIQAKLIQADLRGANLSGAFLFNANLSGATLLGANLSGVTLRGANLSEADLSEADLTDADLTDADLRGATMPDGSKHP